MRNKSEIYALYTRWSADIRGQHLSNREVGRILNVHHKTVAKWVDGIIPDSPQENRVLNKEAKRKRVARRDASKLVNKHQQYGHEHSFQEISVIMGLKPNEVKVLYLNATRKIMIIMERKGIDIGLIPETLEDLHGEF